MLVAAFLTSTSNYSRISGGILHKRR